MTAFATTRHPANTTDRYPSRLPGQSAGLLPRLDPVRWPGRPDGPLDETACKRFERDGFLALPGLFDADEVARLLEATTDLQQRFHGSSEERAVLEPDSGALRSIFQVQSLDSRLERLFRDPRLLDAARQLLGSEVYLHQTRVNYKPGFRGREFSWHSDFETWHVEDGMPAMRALSCAISLTDNLEQNGPLLLVPGSHRHFIVCAGQTPADHYRESLRRQEYGVPHPELISRLVTDGGLRAITGPAGGVVLFDCNTLH
ncbi:MAG: phytanoyl-CoA dioxygenase family protein, partial [Xanthomonadales bacterium]|nr:phytanoyl-CoA dioxygenase family protein [Xanthomonadales bacterium]